MTQSRRGKKRSPSGKAPVSTVAANVPSPARRVWWGEALALMLVLVVNVVIYAPTLTLGYFALDDPDYVVNNPLLHPPSLANLRAILTTPYFANYSPAHLLSYALDAVLAGGRSAMAFHLSNVIWHFAAAAMVYWFARVLRASIGIAGAAALFFTAHPAHVEVVAWISSRKDLVATTFAVASMTLYLLHRQRKRWTWYAVSLAAFLVASAGKQSVALLPAVFLAWDWFVERRRSWWMLADKIPLGLITLFFAWRTAGAQPETRMAHTVYKLGAVFLQDLWLLTGFGDYVLYRRGLESIPAVGAMTIVVPIAAIAVFALPFLLARWMRTWVTGLVAWVFLHLIPPMVLNFVTPVTDRYLFLPSVGVSVLLALGLNELAVAVKHRWAAVVLGCGLLTVWMGKSLVYMGEWRDPRSVWFAAGKKSQAPEVFEHLGTVYQEAGDRIQGFVQTGRALAVSNELALARVVMGSSIAAQLEREWLEAGSVRTNSVAYRDVLWSQAWTEFERAKANLGVLSSPGLFLRRGKLLVSQGSPEQAIPELKHALELARQHSYERIRQEDVTLILRALGIACWTLRRFDEAIPWYEEAVRVQRASGRVWSDSLEAELDSLRRLAGVQKG